MENNWDAIDSLIKEGWMPITVCRDEIKLAKWIDENNKDKGYKVKTFEIKYGK